MNVEIKAPQEFQGSVVSGVNRRKGLIVGSETEGDDVVINAHVSALCDCYIHLSFYAVVSIRRVTYLLGLLLYVGLKESHILLLCLFEEKGDQLLLVPLRRKRLLLSARLSDSVSTFGCRCHRLSAAFVQPKVDDTLV